MQEFTFMIPNVEGDHEAVENHVSKIELHDEHLIFKEEYHVDIKSEALGTMENQYRRKAVYLLRNRAYGCNKHWYCKTKVWGVEIFMAGAEYNLIPCFKREGEAQAFCDALLEWILK